jgi:uncharacterized protein with von Willebrand factor type A (vWA) domain
MPGLLGNLLTFGRLLRRLGLEVHVGRLLDVTEALQHVNLAARDEVFHTCRALLAHRHEDLAVFDRAFDAFWRPGEPGQRVRPPDTDRLMGSDPMTRIDSWGLTLVEAGQATAASALRTWSAAETLAHKDFAEFTAAEIALARAALDRLTWIPGSRRTRRWIAGRGPRIDLRRALARGVRTSGDVVTLPRRRRRTRPRPLVLLCDVSGSMERYSRMLLHFAHAVTARHRRVEAFLFSTRLTRVTPQLRRRRIDEALADVGRTVPDWSGGTRIGEALRQLHRRWTRRVLHGGPVVLIVSDGWDRGDPELLRDQVRRLRRSCHRLIWLNPLIGTIDYAPLTRGLRGALPHVDDFIPARTLTDLAALALHLSALGDRRLVHLPRNARSRVDAADGSGGHRRLHSRG